MATAKTTTLTFRIEPGLKEAIPPGEWELIRADRLRTSQGGDDCGTAGK